MKKRMLSILLVAAMAAALLLGCSSGTEGSDSKGDDKKASKKDGGYTIGCTVYYMTEFVTLMTEGMEKKAEAYQKYNKAAMAEMMIQVLPEIAGRIAEPLSQIDKITIIGSSGDTDNGIGTVAGNVPVVMAKLFESMKETTGVDLAEIMKADTYDAKVTRNVNLTGAPDIVLGSNAPSDSVQPER